MNFMSGCSLNELRGFILAQATSLLFLFKVFFPSFFFFKHFLQDFFPFNTIIH